MDWVKQRADRELDLLHNGREFWEAFAVACETAVASFRRYYPNTPTGVRFERVNGNGLAVHIGRTPHDRFQHSSLTVVAKFSEVQFRIEVEVPTEGKSLFTAHIRRQEEDLVADVGGRLYTAEGLSQLALENYLFPPNAAATPTAPRGG